MSQAITVFTIGHGARSLEGFLALLEGAGIRRLIDVRTAPGSRKHPHFGKDALGASLRERGIAYVWMKELGGWRKARPDSRHTAIRSPGFRGYADHMETEEFREARRRLLALSADEPTAVMCAESLWWRCHRRMLADALTAAGARVIHLMEGSRQEVHRLHPAARLDGDLPVYDVGADQRGEKGGQGRLEEGGPPQDRGRMSRSASSKTSSGSSRSPRAATSPS